VLRDGTGRDRSIDHCGAGQIAIAGNAREPQTPPICFAGLAHREYQRTPLVGHQAAQQRCTGRRLQPEREAEAKPCQEQRRARPERTGAAYKCTSSLKRTTIR
jgi:hypothetical protein